MPAGFKDIRLQPTGDTGLCQDTRSLWQWRSATFVCCAQGDAHQLRRLAAWVSSGALKEADAALLQLAVPVCLQQLRSALHWRRGGDQLHEHFGQVLLQLMKTDTGTLSALLLMVRQESCIMLFTC